MKSSHKSRPQGIQRPILPPYQRDPMPVYRRPQQIPVVFGPKDSITVQPLQTIAIGDTTQLRNPLRTGMWVDEFRFNAPNGRSERPPSFLYQNLVPYGPSGIQVKIALGREPITNGFVPVNALGPILNQWAAEGTPSDSFFVWRLPKPLYLPASELFSVSFFMDPATIVGDVTAQNVSFSVAGRSTAEPQPATLCIPYATATYSSSIVPDSNGNVSFVAPDSALSNPFTIPLRLQRLVGRCSDMGPSIQLTNSQGGQILRTPTRFHDIFQPFVAALSTAATMNPNTFMSFRMSGQTSTDVSLINFVVTAVGYREVQLQ